MDLRQSLIPDELIEDLLQSMPKHTGPDLEADRQVSKYDYIGFMEKMAGVDGRNDVQRPPATSVRNDGLVPPSSPRKDNQ